MDRERFAMLVIVDLDPIPGAFHTPEDAKERVEAMLLSNIPHYSPVVIPYED
jgi:hypothetical protein